MSDPQQAVIRPNDKLEHALIASWLNAANVGLCVLDNTSRIVMLNSAACGMLGIDGLQMLNQPFGKLAAAVKFLPGIAQWLETPGIEGSRHASMTQGNVEVDLLFNAANLENNVAQSVGIPCDSLFKVIAITDVSELLTAQRQVNSEPFRRQWQALNAGVVISDARAPGMPIVYVNPMFETMCGYTSAEVLGRNCRFLQGSEPNQPGLIAIRTAINTQSNGYARLRNFRKDGSLFVNELFISPVKDAQGVVTHFVGIQHLQIHSAA